MSSKSLRVTYWIATSVVTAIVLMYSGNSLFNKELFDHRFAGLGYPTYIIYPLTIAKLLGLLVIWFAKWNSLKEWAYAGFFFVFVLAILAEVNAAEGEYISSLTALVSLLISYFAWKEGVKRESLKIGLMK